MTPRPTSLLRRPENWLLLAFFAALTAQSLWAASQDMMLSKRVVLADQLALSVIVALWVMYDSGRHGIRRPFIFGYFLLVAWPLVAPFHLWTTRRWRALITLVIFFGLWLVSASPYIVQDVRNFTAVPMRVVNCNERVRASFSFS